MDSLYCQSDPQSDIKWSSNATVSTGRSVKMVPQNLLVQKQLHDDFSARMQLRFDQFLHSFLWW